MNRKQRIVFLTLSSGTLALFAGLQGYVTAFLASLLVLVAIGLAYVWNRFVFRKLYLKRSLNRTYAEFDSLITMEVALTNRKALPLFGLKLENTVSADLEFVDPRQLISVQGGGENIFFDYFHLNWYEKRKRVYKLRPLRRGRFELGPGTLSYADPFGFFVNKQEDILDSIKLTVFPKIVSIQGQTALNTYLFGSLPREGWIYTDPLNRMGTKAYQATDSARQINWKATARHVALQVDVEKPSFDQQVYLLLVQPPKTKWWVSAVNNRLEVAIMTAASLIDNYLQVGYRVSLATNLVSQVYGLSTGTIHPILGKAQRVQLLTALALLHSFSVEPEVQVVERVQRGIRPGSTLVVINTDPGKFDLAFVGLLRRLMARVRVGVLRVGTEKDSVCTPGLKEWKIEGGLPWYEISSLELS